MIWKFVSSFSQLQQAEETRETEMTDVNALTDEFTRRMGEAERKMQTILKVGMCVVLFIKNSDVYITASICAAFDLVLGQSESGSM